MDRHIDRSGGVVGRYGVGQRNLKMKMLLEFCLGKELCVLNAWFSRMEKRKLTFRLSENEIEIAFVLI